MKTVEYTFIPNSIAGLNKAVVVQAHSYIEAKQRVLKWIYTEKTEKHTVEEHITIGVYVDCVKVGE